MMQKGPRRCPECFQKRHNAGNFWLPHSETYHILIRNEYRHSLTWRMTLAGIIIIAIAKRGCGCFDKGRARKC
jgi:hypothetical protein